MKYYVQELTEDRQTVSSQEFENIDGAINRFAESTAYICTIKKHLFDKSVMLGRKQATFDLYYINQATKSSTHKYSDLDTAVKKFRYYVKRYL